MSSQKKSRKQKTAVAQRSAYLFQKKTLKSGVALFGTAAVMASSVGLTGLSVAPAFAVDEAAPVAATDVVPESNSSQIIEADAIASGYINSGTDMTNAQGTVSGRAYMAGYAELSPVSSTSSVPEGTTVYLQWMDQDGTVSPIYSAKTHNLNNTASNQAGPGAYAFDLREGWTDANGVTRKFDAAASERVRIWIEDFTTESGNRATMQRVAGGLLPGSFSRALASSQGRSMGDFLLAGTNLQRTAIWMFEEPVGSYMTRPHDEWIDGTYSGALTGARAIEGTVWYETNSYDGTAPDSGGDPRAVGKTVVFSSLTEEGRQAYEAAVSGLPELERAAAAKQLLTDNPQYISATVYTTTDENGNYRVQFPEGTFQKNYVYGMVLDDDGSILNTYSSGFTTPEFRSAAANAMYRPSPIVNTALIQSYSNVNFAIATSNIVDLNITNYDATANPANVGDRAQIDLSGAQLSPLPNRLVWTNSAGEVVKEIKDVTSHEDAEERGFLDVPANAVDGEVYTVTLYTLDEPIASDSFTVQVPGEDSTDAANINPVYDAFTATAGEESTVPAPVNEDGSALPIGTTFTAGNNVREGFTVNEDGSITVSPDVPVGDYRVPVVVKYPDGSSETVFAPVTVKTPQAEVNTPVYTDGATEVGTALTVPAPTFDNPATDVVETGPAPEGTTFGTPEGTTLPEGVVVNEDGSITVGENTPAGDYTVPVLVTYPDGSTDTVEVSVSVTPDVTDPTVEPIADVTVDEDTPLTAIPVTVADNLTENPAVDVEGLPEGVTYNEQTGEITGTPTTPGTYPVTVTVTDAAGNTVTETFTITVNDVIESTDADENNPVYSDGAGTPGESVTVDAPKNADGSDVPAGTEFVSDNPAIVVDPATGVVTVEVPADAVDGDVIEGVVTVTYPDGTTDTVPVRVTVGDTVAPAVTPIGDQTVTEGEGITPVVVTVDDPAATVTVTGLPEGVVFNPETGEITGTPTVAGTYEVTVTVVDPSGNESVETFTIVVNEVPVEPTPEPTDAEQNTPVYTEGSTEVGTALTVPAPTFDNPATDVVETGPAPEGTTFGTPEGTTLPEGVVVNPDGSITVGENTPAGDYTVPVLVTYPDGTTDTVQVKVVVSEAPVEPTPEPTQADTFEPVVQQQDVKVGAEVDPQDSVANFADLPAGTVVEFKDPVDTSTVGEKSAVVVVTYPDGSSEEVVVTVVVSEDAPVTPEPTPDAPSYNDSSTTPGDPVVIVNDGGSADGYVVTVEGPGTAVINENGNLVVTPSEDAKAGDTIVVTVKDQDGNVVDTVTVTIDPTLADTFEPVVLQQDVKVGAEVDPQDSVANFADLPAGTVVEFKDPVDTSTVGEKSAVVVVTYPDGSSEEVVVTVVVSEDAPVTPEPTDAEQNAPVYTDGAGTPGESVTVDAPKNADGSDVPAGTEFVSDNPAIVVDPATGAVTVEVPADAVDGDVIEGNVTVTYPDGTVDVVPVKVTVGDQVAPVVTTIGDQTVTEGEAVTPVVVTVDDPAATVTVTGLPEGVVFNPETGEITGTPTVAGTYEVTVTVVDPSGNESVETFTIVVNEVPVEPTPEPTDPAPAPEAPAYGDSSTTPGNPVAIPNEGGTVDPGTTVEVAGPGTAVVDENGNLVVTPSEDAKPGDTITVTIKDQDGNVVDTVTVEIAEPQVVPTPEPTDPAPAPQPTNPAPAPAPEQPADWEDGSVTPGTTITIPNKGGTVDPGTTVEVAGPGKAEIKENGDLAVTPSEDAKAGDTITVTVKDADGKVVDKVTVTVADKPKADAGNTGTTGAPVAPGNTGTTNNAPAAPAPAAPAQTQQQSSLANTGATGVGALAGAGVLALLAGGILVAARRRRNA